MTTFARPEDYEQTAEPFRPISTPPIDPMTRIAVALEQIALALLDRPGATQGPAPLAALPPVAPMASANVCPVHRLPWKVVPAGVSKRTGKPYDAFSACPEQGCDQRPR